MDAYLEANKRLWNEWTRIHEKSLFYDVEGFRAGNRRLHPLEIEEVGDVSGKSLLHLQCHFGLDTLSWAGRGATVTGADFSEEAIALAISLSEEVKIPARFLRANIYDLPDLLHEQFDIVFTSYGAITWLPDIYRWAEVAAGFVKPGGFFYIAEFHPFSYVFDDGAEAKGLKVHYPYFNGSDPMAFPVWGSYADKTAQVNEPNEYCWSHTMGDIVTALASAGLRIEFLHEHPFSVNDQLPFMELAEDRYWRLKVQRECVPLMFSIRASKPG
jgi:SAM-dependent methyltransferase